MCVCPKHTQKKKRGGRSVSVSPVKAQDAGRLCCRRQFKGKSLIDARLRMLTVFMPPLWRVKNTKPHSERPLKCCPHLCPYVPQSTPAARSDALHIKTVKCTPRRWFLRGLLITIPSLGREKKKPFWCNKEARWGQIHNSYGKWRTCEFFRASLGVKTWEKGLCVNSWGARKGIQIFAFPLLSAVHEMLAEANGG